MRQVQSLQTRPRAAKGRRSWYPGFSLKTFRVAFFSIVRWNCPPAVLAATTTPRATPCRSHELVLPGEEGERRPAPPCMLRL